MTFLIVMISLLATALAYGGVGTTFARKHYAKIMTERSKSSGIEARLEQAKLELSGLRHGICNLNYSTMIHKGCDCGQGPKWRALKSEINQLKSGRVSEPGVLTLASTVVFWPVVGYVSYLKSAPYTDYAAIERMENEIKEIR